MLIFLGLSFLPAELPACFRFEARHEMDQRRFNSLSATERAATSIPLKRGQLVDVPLKLVSVQLDRQKFCSCVTR